MILLLGKLGGSGRLSTSVGGRGHLFDAMRLLDRLHNLKTNGIFGLNRENYVQNIPLHVLSNRNFATLQNVLKNLKFEIY